jgi:tRNA modification GTPase
MNTAAFERTSFHFHRSSPPGEGGVALFELYGEGARPALQAICRPRSGGLPAPGHARIVDFLDAAGEPLDEAILSQAPAGSTWSGLESWILSVHGGIWMGQKVEESLAALGGVPLTADGVLRRAVESGALDAVQAAACKLLVEARTEKAARFFSRQRCGELSSRVREALDALERNDLSECCDILRGLAGAYRPAYRLGCPLHVLIAGRPNAGKSTLFNRLVEEERAAVTSIPGTTRDLLEEMVALEDYPVLLKDGAGLQPLNSVGPIEREGIRKVLESARDAVIYLIPYPWERLAQDQEFLSRQDPDRKLVVASLSDLAREGHEPPADLSLSALTGEGVEALKRAIVRRWIDDRERPSEAVPCAPFTPSQEQCILEGLALAEGGGNLDAIRTALVESLLHSWSDSEAQLE